MSTAQRIRGVLSPVLTPFEPDLRPAADRFLRHCRWLLDQDVGLAVFGTNSEANSLSVDERIELLDTLVDGGPRRGPHDARHRAAAHLPDTVDLTAHAVKLGCAGVLMLPPFYYKGVSDDGLFRSFAEVIERRRRRPAARLPLPHPAGRAGADHADVDRAAAEGVSRHRGRRQGQLRRLEEHASDARAVPAAAGFDVFAGSETFLLATLRAGGAGLHHRDRQREPGPDRQALQTVAERRCRSTSRRRST